MTGALLLVAAAAACDVGAAVDRALTLEPAQLAVRVELGAAPAVVQLRAFAVDPTGEQATDVTALARWSWRGPSQLARVTGPGELEIGLGGRGELVAIWEGHRVVAPLVATLTGTVYAPGTDDGVAARFAAAQPASGEPTIAIRYPDDGAVLPGNMSPVDLFWDDAAGADAFRIRVHSEDTVDVALYARDRQAAFPAEAWASVLSSALDQTLEIQVDGVDPAGIGSTSPVRALEVAADLLDDSPIFVHPATGGIVAFEPATGALHAIASAIPAHRDGVCTGCHRLSPDGRRLGYSTANQGEGGVGYGIAQLEPGLGFLERVDPQLTAGGLAAFLPDGDAMAVSAVFEGVIRLELHHPITGATVPSNIEPLHGALNAELGTNTIGASWSADGTTLVFTQEPPPTATGLPAFFTHAGRGSVVAVHADVGAAGAIQFGAPRVIAARPEDGVSGYHHPVISADGAAVVFARGVTGDDGRPRDRQVMIARADGTGIWEVPGGDHDANMAVWSPTTTGKRYAWIVFSSRRPYGDQTGQSPFRYLWVSAIDLERLAAGDDNPASPAVFLPGQDLARQYAHPQWPARAEGAVADATLVAIPAAISRATPAAEWCE